MSSESPDRAVGEAMTGDQGLRVGTDVLGTEIAGRYRLESVLGRGGMSVVYRATDSLLGRTVAIKSFHPGLADAADLRRQSGEIRLLAGLNHPAIVTLFDAVAVADDRVDLIMEYVQGVDLGRELTLGALQPKRVAAIGLDLSRALSYVHARGIVHRDIKPANVLVPELASDGAAHARLADFGIARLVDGARLTAAGSVIGTAGYLSPEQALGAEPGPPGDVYSLGLVLLECLTGERAFPGSAIESAAARVSRDPDIPRDLPAPWRDLLRRMTTRDPGERITAPDCVTALEALAVAPLESAPEPDTALSPVESTGATRVLPLDHGALHDGGVRDASDSPTELLTRDDSVAPRPPRRLPRRRILVAAGIGLVLVAAVSVGAGLVGSAPDDATSVTYPAVDGDLGDHLDQLQRSVER